MPHGPCQICGETDYSLSFGGPSVCPSCDCGIPPKQAKLARENQQLRADLTRLRLELDALKGNAAAVEMLDHLNAYEAGTVATVRP